MKTLHVSTTIHDRWNGPKRYIRILVYDTLEEFEKASVSHERRRSGSKLPWDDAVGGFFPVNRRERYNKKTKKWYPIDRHFAGTMRLVDEYCSDEVIFHETTHAAIQIYRQDCEDDVRLGEGCDNREENLAYIIGDLGSQICAKLIESGVWP